MNRNQYDLTHQVHTIGHIGRLQTLSIIPLIAGDSIEYNLEGIIRLAQTRKEIVQDAQIDICGFYVPHRHIYGTDAWKLFMNGGVDGTNVFTGVSIGAALRAEYLLQNALNTVTNLLPRWLVEGYNYIFQRYYAVPNTENNGQDTQTAFTDLDYFPDTDVNHLKFGKLAARLPHILNGGNPVDNLQTAAGYTLDLNDTDAEVPVSTVLDIRDLAAIKARYKSETETTWFNAWYKDLMANKWGTQINADVDLRPELLFRETRMLSGMDINGTDDATLGSYVGKTLAPIQVNMPRKVFMEHGTMWVLALVRYPLVHVNETHPLSKVVAPDYTYWMGDQDIVAAQQPVTFTPNIYLSGGSPYVANAEIKEPYGQHYRFQPHTVHSIYNDIPGYPFTKWTATNLLDWYYYLNNEYFDTFHTSQLAQWQIHSQAFCKKFSTFPDPRTSIFAGV